VKKANEVKNEITLSQLDIGNWQQKSIVATKPIIKLLKIFNGFSWMMEDKILFSPICIIFSNFTLFQ
jgi:hypothetical protein